MLFVSLDRVTLVSCILLNEMMCDKTTHFKSFMFMCIAFYLYSEANPVRQEDHSTVYMAEVLVEGNIQSA